MTILTIKTEALKKLLEDEELIEKMNQADTTSEALKILTEATKR